VTHDIIATRIIAAFHAAETDLVGSTVQTFNGEAGTCKGVRLDDHHGLCFTFDDPPSLFEGPSQKWYPVSTIRMKS
jgi:hypothetical protein